MRQLPDILIEKIKSVGGKAALGRMLGGLTGQAILNYTEGGGSVEVLQDLMDHENISTTMIYSHMTDKRKREQKEKAFS